MQSSGDYDSNVAPLKDNHIYLKNYELVVNPTGKNPLQFSLRPIAKGAGSRVWEFEAKDEQVLDHWLNVFKEEGVERVASGAK